MLAAMAGVLARANFWVLRDRLLRGVRASGVLPELGIGALCGLAAVAIRFARPLPPEQLPTLPVVVALAIVTTFVGVEAGIATSRAVMHGPQESVFSFCSISTNRPVMSTKHVRTAADLVRFKCALRIECDGWATPRRWTALRSPGS